MSTASVSQHESDPAAAAREARARQPRSYIAQVTLAVLGNWGAVIGIVWVAVVAFAAVFGPVIATSHPLLWHAEGEWRSPMLRHFSAVDVLLLGLAMALPLVLALGRRPWAAGVGALVCTGAAALVGVVLTLAWPIGPVVSAMLILLVPAVALGLLWIGGFERGSWRAGGGAALGVVLLAMLAAFGWSRLPDAWAGMAIGTAMLVLLLGLGAWLASGTTVLRRLGTLVLALLVLVPPAVAMVSPPTVIVYSSYREALASGEADYALMAPIPYSPTDRQRDRARTRSIESWWGPVVRAHVAGVFGEEADEASWTDRERHAHEAGHWMGTDRKGADVLSRMIHASRIALSIGFIATGIALGIGVVVGGLMGYFAGLVDLLGMRLVEVFNAIPTLFLLIAFVAFFDRNLYLIMVIIGLTSWMGYAMFTRAEFLRLRQQEFILAAQAAAVPLRSILFKHMLPNGMAPIVVSASFGVASAILMESFLSFLGLGLVDEPSWGQMLSDAVGPGGTFSWWIALFPGLAIFLTVYAYNLIGEALRDAIDPRLANVAR